MVTPYNPVFRKMQQQNIFQAQNRTDNMRAVAENKQRYEQAQAIQKQALDTEITGNLARGVLNASPEQKQATYQNAMKIAEQRGISLQGMPTEYTKEVDSYLTQMSNVSPSSAKSGDSQLDYLKEGFDPTRINEEGYIQDRLEAGQAPTSNTEFAYNISEMRKAGVDEDVIQTHIADRVATQAKGFDTLRGQTQATVEPKLQLEREYQPTTEGLKEKAKLEAREEVEPRIKTAMLTAEQKVKTKQKLAQTEQDFKTASKTIENIQATLKEQPELVGILSEGKSVISQITGGEAGYTPEQMQSRGKVINQITQGGLQMIGLATDAGLSGINSIAEAKRIIGNLTPDSTAEEIIGATDALLLAKKDVLEALRERAGKSSANEGQTAVNPQTGERVILRNGKWEAM